MLLRITKLFLCFLFAIPSYGQSTCTFNTSLNLEPRQSVLNSVVEYNGEYIAIGIAVNDKPPFFMGSKVWRIDSLGEYFTADTLFAEDRSVEAWGRESMLLADGNVYFTGYSVKSGRELLVGKYNPVNESVNYRTIPHPNYPDDDWVTGLGLTRLNDQAVVFGNEELSDGSQLTQGLIASIDDNLAINEKELILKPAPSNVTIFSAYQKANRNLLVLYYEAQTGTFCEPYIRLFLREYDSLLSEVVREYEFPFSQDFIPLNASICEGEDGKVYIHVRELDYLSTNPECNVGFVTDPRVYKFNDTLGLIWIKDFTRPQDFDYDSGVADIVNTQDGNFVTAFSVSIPADTAALLFQTAVQVIKFTPDGELLFRRMYSSFGPSDTISVSNTIHDVKATADGGFVMVGETRRTPTNFAVDTTADFTQRGWILKLDAEGMLRPSCLDTTVSSQDYLLDNEFGGLVFPNPTNDLLNVQLSGDWNKDLQFSIINQAGQQLINRQSRLPDPENTTYTFDVQDLPAGIYFLRVTDGVRNWSRKVIKR